MVGEPLDWSSNSSYLSHHLKKKLNCSWTKVQTNFCSDELFKWFFLKKKVRPAMKIPVHFSTLVKSKDIFAFRDFHDNHSISWTWTEKIWMIVIENIEFVKNIKFFLNFFHFFFFNSFYYYLFFLIYLISHTARARKATREEREKIKKALNKMIRKFTKLILN